MKQNKSLEFAAETLVIIGGLDWLLIGVFKYDLVAHIFGAGSGLSRLIYTLVGLSAAWWLYKMVNKSSTSA